MPHFRVLVLLCLFATFWWQQVNASDAFGLDLPISWMCESQGGKCEKSCPTHETMRFPIIGGAQLSPCPQSLTCCSIPTNEECADFPLSAGKCQSKCKSSQFMYPAKDCAEKKLSCCADLKKAYLKFLGAQKSKKKKKI